MVAFHRYGLEALLSIGLTLGPLGCSSDNGGTSSDAAQTQATAQFALSPSSLPGCNKSTDGEIWYVWSSSQFEICQGSTSNWKVTNINGLNAAVRATSISAGSTCPTGGMTIQFGLDTNRNGKLDDSEVASTTNLCNGATGATGTAGAKGSTGATGATGATGTSGATGTAGPQGSTGATGPQGSTGATGTAGATGSQGATGATGANGTQGATGSQGPTGTQGASGTNGQSCWDLNGDGVCDVATEDKDGNGACDAADCQGAAGTNGNNGAPGQNSLVLLTPVSAGTPCPNGGVEIQTGLDLNGDGILQPNEVSANGTQYVCNGIVSTPGSDAGTGGSSGAGGATSTSGASPTGGASTGGTVATGGADAGPTCVDGSMPSPLGAPVYIDVSTGIPMVTSSAWWFWTSSPYDLLHLSVTQIADGEWEIDFGIVLEFNGCAYGNRGVELVNPATGELVLSYGIDSFSYNNQYQEAEVYSRLWVRNSAGQLAGRTPRISNAVVPQMCQLPQTFQLAVPGIVNGGVDVYIKAQD